LAQAAQGSGGVPIPGGVQKTRGCGTWGHGLADMGVLGGWLDSMILKVFSSLNDSVILQKTHDGEAFPLCHSITVSKRYSLHLQVMEGSGGAPS